MPIAKYSKNVVQGDSKAITRDKDFWGGAPKAVNKDTEHISVKISTFISNGKIQESIIKQRIKRIEKEEIVKDIGKKDKYESGNKIKEEEKKHEDDSDKDMDNDDTSAADQISKSVDKLNQEESKNE